MNDSQEIERARQSVIADYQLADAGTDPEFDAVTKLAADMFDVPVAMVTVLTSDLQLFRGCHGLEQTNTNREDAFCNTTVEKAGVFVVEDAQEDPAFRNNPLVVGEPHIRFYAGSPIIIGEGVAVGALCLVDRRKRHLCERDRNRLEMLAELVATIMELRIGSKLAELRKQSLERQTELLRATIDHVQQGIAVFDSDLKMVLWNDLYFDLLNLPDDLRREGCDAGEMLMVAARAGTFGPGNLEEMVGTLLHSIKTTPSRRLDVRTSDGRILDAWRAAISDGRSIIAVQDVTEQRRVDELKSEFVSTVSHELRTPLTSIKGALAILGKDADLKLDERDRQMLTIASKNVERLSVLINDILDIGKAEQGSLVMQMEPVDLLEIVREACEQNRPFAMDHGVEIAVKAPPPPLIVDGDSSRLIQAVTNLISNACKFSPRGETVTVSAVRDRGMAAILVDDNGPGIPVEFRPFIFGRFAQAGADHQQGRAGSGLGLAITKAIVDMHRGEISYDSQVPGGTCFRIHLPLKEPVE